MPQREVISHRYLRQVSGSTLSQALAPPFETILSKHV